MDNLSAIRKRNFLCLLASGFEMKDIATKANVNYVYLSQIKSGVAEGKARKAKQMGYEVARKIESGLGLEYGWMDIEQPAPESFFGEKKKPGLSGSDSRSGKQAGGAESVEILSEVSLELLKQASSWIELSDCFTKKLDLDPIAVGKWMGQVDLVLRQARKG